MVKQPKRFDFQENQCKPPCLVFVRSYQIAQNAYSRLNIFRSFEPEKVYSAVIPGEDVGIPEAVILNWEYRTNPLNPLTWRIVSPRVYIQHIIAESLEHNAR